MHQNTDVIPPALYPPVCTLPVTIVFQNNCPLHPLMFQMFRGKLRIQVNLVVIVQVA